MTSNALTHHGYRVRHLAARLWLAWLVCFLTATAWAQDMSRPPRVRNVYIPSDQLKVVFGDGAKGVLMPRDQILSLWQQAQRAGGDQATAPADAVLSQASYQAYLDEHELRITGRIRITKLKGDWQAVDLPCGGMAIESALLNGEPARLGHRGDGTLLLVLQEEGEGELVLEMSAPLVRRGGDLAVTLGLPPVPASDLWIRLDAKKQLQVGETICQPEANTSDPGGAQLFRVAVNHTGHVPLVISDRFAGGGRSPLVLVRSRQVNQLEPAGLRWQADLAVEVYARATDTFELQLTGALDIAEVEAPQLSRWTLQELPRGQTGLTLTFRRPVLGSRSVRLLGLAPAPLDVSWDVPTVRVEGAASHVGHVEVRPAASLRVETGALLGVRSQHLPRGEEMAQDAEAGSLDDQTVAREERRLEFAFWQQDFRLPLRAVPRQRVVQTSLATLIDIGPAKLLLRSSVTIQARYSPVFAVQLQVPNAWQVNSVLLAGVPVVWEVVERGPDAVDTSEPLQTIHVELAQPLHPGQSGEIELRAQRYPPDWLTDDGSASVVPLPEVRVVGADELEGTILIQTPPDIELQMEDLSSDLQPVAADPTRAELPQAATALQFRYQDQAVVRGQLNVRTKPAKVSAETLAFARLDHTVLHVHYQLDLHVTRGKIHDIHFTLPAALGNRIQVSTVDSPVRIIEQQRMVKGDSDSGAMDEAQSQWKIVLDQPVTSDLTLAVSCEQALDTAAASTEMLDRPWTIPVLVLADVSRQSGIVALEAAGDQEIAFAPENLRDLDPADVPQPRAYVPRQRIVAAYQYARLPYRLTASATGHKSEPVLTAVCESTEITSVPTREGRTLNQARFLLRTANLQHALVKLPEGAELWSAVLDGDPIEVRESQGSILVPLPPRTAAATEARDLTLLYETASPTMYHRGLWDRLLPQPFTQSPPEIEMTTLGTSWYLHPPEGMKLVSSSGPLRPEERLSRGTFVGLLAESIVQQSTARLPFKFGGLVLAAIVVGILAVITQGNRRGSFTLLELLAVFAVIGILVGLLLPATQSARGGSTHVVQQQSQADRSGAAQLP